MPPSHAWPSPAGRGSDQRESITALCSLVWAVLDLLITQGCSPSSCCLAERHWSPEVIASWSGSPSRLRGTRIIAGLSLLVLSGAILWDLANDGFWSRHALLGRWADVMVYSGSYAEIVDRHVELYSRLYFV